MEYTKGKWTACAFGVRVNDMEIADCVLGNVRQPGMTITEAQANAERIVKAVNCHDDLVEALNSWSELQDMRPLDSGEDMQQVLRKCWGKTLKALALAEAL